MKSKLNACFGKKVWMISPGGQIISTGNKYVVDFMFIQVCKNLKPEVSTFAFRDIHTQYSISFLPSLLIPRMLFRAL